MIALAALALMQASPAEPVCIRQGDPPAGLEAWTRPAAPSATALPGTAYALTMGDAATVRFAVAPGKAPAAGSYGTVVPLKVQRAGTYRVAISTGAWLDVTRDGKVLDSVAHTHGPPCTGIRKIVDFVLKPGRYAVQISGAKEPGAILLVAPK